MKTLTLSLMLVFPILAFADGVETDPGEEPFTGIVERTTYSGNGTPANPLTETTWQDLSVDGLVNTTHSKKVFESKYYWGAIWADTRDASGVGTNSYTSDDHIQETSWEWNRWEALDDPGGTLVVTNFGGYWTWYSALDTYTLFGLVDEDADTDERWYSNATAATLDPPLDATRRVSGYDERLKNVWNERAEYMTLEKLVSTDVETGIKDGTQIERSETVVPPIILLVKTTKWWGEFDQAAFGGAGGVVQKEEVTNTEEEGPWAMDDGMEDVDDGVDDAGDPE